MLKRIYQALSVIGPGIMAIGYTIGTGSVTSMIVAGSQFGMQLLWVLVLSCLFSWVMMEAYGRYYLVTGETALYSFRKRLKFGGLIAVLVGVSVVAGQWNALIGILGLSANAIFETLALFFPILEGRAYWIVLLIAISIIGMMYFILLKGDFSIFERVLVFFVALMGLSFLISLFVVLPDPEEIVRGLRPSIPQVEGGRMMVAAFVGTTMASATFISRPLFLQGKGWDRNNLRDQQRDALWAASLILLISGAIMAVGMGAFFRDGRVITRVLDMVTALEPVAGRLAIVIFISGTLAAGLSSVFPILMIAPLLVTDFQNGTLDLKSRRFKILTAVACLVSLTVPIFGYNPVQAQILTQVVNVFALPLVILGIMILINRRELMGEQRAGWWLNAGMVSAFMFACLISYNGVVVLLERL